MKQKLIIGLSVFLLVLAVFLIARDLFDHTPSYTAASCCGYEDDNMKVIDSALLGYQRIAVVETGMRGLTGIALDAHERIYVTGQNRVARFTAEGMKTREFKTDTATNCIAVQENRVYTGQGAMVICHDTSGHRITAWKPYNPQGYITSVTVSEKYVFAADAMNKRILKYTPEGILEQEFGKKDSATGARGFVIPSMYFDIATGGFGDLWAVNPGRLEVENYTLNGTFRTSWGRETFENSGFIGCCNPVHFTLLPDGSFVTYEKGVDKVKLFDPTGRFVCMVAGAGSFKGKTDFQLGRNNLVKDMTADAVGKIYILDAYNRVNVFIKKDLQKQTYEKK